MLRNPVDRAYSQYQMMQNVTGKAPARGQAYYMQTPFEQAVADEIKHIRSSGITANSSYEEFKIKLIETAPVDHGFHSILARGMYYFQLMPYMAQWPKDKLKIVLTKEIEGPSDKVQELMNDIFTYLKLPKMKTINVEPRHIGKYEIPMSDKVRKHLEAFFKPYNQKLFQLLGKELDW
jgi:hypothetical protein